MTPPPVADLIERLRTLEPCAAMSDEAAATLTAQAEENRALREALVQADLTIRSLPGTDQSHVDFIRAVLTQGAER